MSEHPLWVPCWAGETLEEAGGAGGSGCLPSLPDRMGKNGGLSEVGRSLVCIKQILLLPHLPGCLAVEKAQIG